MHRIYVNDKENRVTSPALVKLKEIKKGYSLKLKELEKAEDLVKRRVDRKSNKIGLIAKAARLKAESA